MHQSKQTCSAARFTAGRFSCAAGFDIILGLCALDESQTSVSVYAAILLRTIFGSALPGLQLAQSDLTRGALDPSQAKKIRDAVVEVVDDLIDKDDQSPTSETTHDAEAAAAVETLAGSATLLPVLKKEQLAPRWEAEKPVLCVAGRTSLDEAVAVMLAQLLEKHGLGARVEGTEAIALTNVFRLETAGTAMVCLSYLDARSPAHMRYTIRRMRRKLPNARILLGCWATDVDAKTLLEAAKPDEVATTLSDAVRMCIEAADNTKHSSLTIDAKVSA